MKFNRYIPLYIYPIQIFSKHGTQVALNPQFSGISENKIIWQISSIINQVQKVQQLFDNALKNYQDWFDLILVYLIGCYFYSHKKQGRKYTFKYKYVSSVVNLRNKIPDNHNLAKLLKDVNNKLKGFKVTEIDQDIVESTMLDRKNLIQQMIEKLSLLS